MRTPLCNSTNNQNNEDFSASEDIVGEEEQAEEMNWLNYNDARVYVTQQYYEESMGIFVQGDYMEILMEEEVPIDNSLVQTFHFF